LAIAGPASRLATDIIQTEVATFVELSRLHIACWAPHRDSSKAGRDASLSVARKLRNVLFVLLGVGVLMLKDSYAGPMQDLVRSYAGNVFVSFALYFVSSFAARDCRHARLLAVLVALVAVTSFELTDGFGFMANVYDPVDLLANSAGIGLAVGVDVLTARLTQRRNGGPEAVA
jgi:hypothetical protein